MRGLREEPDGLAAHTGGSDRALGAIRVSTVAEKNAFRSPSEIWENVSSRILF